MKYLITGATGLVGTSLVHSLLDRGVEVNYLTTQVKSTPRFSRAREFHWDPIKGLLDTRALEGVSVVIHLAGASIAKPWTKSYKNEIVQSRVEGLNVLAQAIKEGHFPVVKLVSASATGIYPSDLDQVYTEDSSAVAQDFLGEVVQRWETAADQFNKLGIEVVKCRFGLVFSLSSGSLPAMVTPVRWGIGSALGAGQQWQSWIHLRDLTKLLIWCAVEAQPGVYNAVAPNPLRQIELAQAIARCLRKPFWAPAVPGFALKLILGERSALVLSSQRVSADKVTRAGFVFDFPEITSALTDLLGPTR